MRLKYLFFALASFIQLLLFSSCITYRVIEIQTLRPAEIHISKEFTKPTLVASVYQGIRGIDESMAQAALDSTAAVEAIFVLAESLYESPKYSGLDISTRIYFRNDASQFILPFEWNVVEGLAAQNNSDLLISLEYIKLRPVNDSYSFWDGYMSMNYGYLTMHVYAFWRVYDVKNRKIITDYLHRDTLTWEKVDYNRVRIGDQLPGFFSAATYSGYSTGKAFANKIAPTWMDEQRLYFIEGAKPMREAAKFAQSNQWLDAAKKWQSIIQNPKAKPVAAARAAFNMAVANEMNGNFEAALEWLDQSRNYYKLPEEPWYRRILELRLKVAAKL